MVLIAQLMSVLRVTGHQVVLLGNVMMCQLGIQLVKRVVLGPPVLPQNLD